MMSGPDACTARTVVVCCSRANHTDDHRAPAVAWVRDVAFTVLTATGQAIEILMPLNEDERRRVVAALRSIVGDP